MLASKLGARPLHRGDQRRRSLKGAANRALDVALAMFLLVLALPLILSISLLIVLDDPGPILTRHRRVDIDGRQVGLWKFRTQLVAADAKLVEYQSLHKGDELRHHLGQALGRDPRRSRFGSVLHRTGLEDIPMLGNIVGGQLPVFGRYTWRQFVSWLDAGDDVSLTRGGSLQEDADHLS